MAVLKADTNTAKNKQQEYFSDFLDSFAITPIGNNLGKVINERSVTQSIKNLIYTLYGERLFQPNVGSMLSTALFQFDDSITDASIVTSIENTIQYYEPRAANVTVVVDSQTDYNSIAITITYSLINNSNTEIISLTLQRVR